MRILAVRKLTMFLFQENAEEIMESKRNASSSGASSDGVSLCLYLAMIATFASPSFCIKLHGYDFDNMVSTKIILWITIQTVITKIEYRKQ